MATPWLLNLEKDHFIGNSSGSHQECAVIIKGRIMNAGITKCCNLIGSFASCAWMHYQVMRYNIIVATMTNVRRPPGSFLSISKRHDGTLIMVVVMTWSYSSLLRKDRCQFQCLRQGINTDFTISVLRYINQLWWDGVHKDHCTFISELISD